MNRKKELSVLSIMFLLFQLLMPGIGFAVNKFQPTETTKSENAGQVAVKEVVQDDNSITWKIWLNESETENEEVTTKVKLDSGLTKGKIIKNDNVKIEEVGNGYLILTPKGSSSYVVEIKTAISDKDKKEFSVEAIANVSGKKFKASDKALNEGKIKREKAAAEKAEAEKLAAEKAEAEKLAEEKAEAEKLAQEKAEAEKLAQEKAEAEKAAQEKAAQEKAEAEKLAQEKAEAEKTTQEKAEAEEKKNNKKEFKTDKEGKKDKEKKDKQKEEKMIPLEQELSRSPGDVKSFTSSQKRMLSTVDEASVDHNIASVGTDNICLREVEGTIDINLPVPTEKKPVDIVVVQDASGSYSGNEAQVKQSLKDIVDMLDLSQDRMMVTSYRDFDGWKQYDNTSDYNAGILRPSSWGYTNPRSSGTSGLKTINHSGLSNNANSLKASINAITFEGATPTASGLEFAKNEYAAAPTVPGENPGDRETVFILITDGVANIQLDGYIHLNRQLGTAWAESNQFYQETFDEVLGVANSIKGQGYEMISAYWENKSVLRGAYGTNYYNNTVGPAARNMLQNVASSPNNYSSNEDLAMLIADLLANLDTTLNQYNGFKTEFDIAQGFELVPGSIELNGSPVTVSQNGSKVTVTNNKIKSGASTLTYKLKEVAVHGNQTTPITNGVISYDETSNGFNETLNIPDVNLVGNPNSDKCEEKVEKSISLGDSNDFTTNIELEEYSDLFTYKLVYQFDEKINQYETIQLKDELEGVLELIGNAGDITIDSGNIQNLGATINLLSNQSGFTIDIPKKNNSYNYLAGKKIIVTFQVKIKDGITSVDLINYPEQKIPNQGSMVLDEEIKDSNKVYVQPPKRGTIKIIKEDVDDSQIKLEGAKFDIYDSNDQKVGELITGPDGTATSAELPVGEYSLVEVEAPAGYEIDSTDLAVSVVAGDETQKTIKNKKLKGTIKIIKVDADNLEMQLPGAKFEIFNSDGDSIGTIETGADGTIVSEELPAGEYTLVEENAPVGYEIITTDLTVIVEGGKQTVKTIENKKLKGTVTINKQDDNEAPLPEAEFTLTGPNNYKETVVSQADGKIVFDNLEWGEYTLKETKAPEGYRLLEKEISITIDKENLNIEKTIVNTKQDWEIPETGGIGTLGFYGIGLLFMAIAAWFILRKRRTE